MTFTPTTPTLSRFAPTTNACIYIHVDNATDNATNDNDDTNTDNDNDDNNATTDNATSNATDNATSNATNNDDTDNATNNATNNNDNDDTDTDNATNNDNDDDSAHTRRNERGAQGDVAKTPMRLSIPNHKKEAGRRSPRPRVRRLPAFASRPQRTVRMQPRWRVSITGQRFQHQAVSREPHQSPRKQEQQALVPECMMRGFARKKRIRVTCGPPMNPP